MNIENANSVTLRRAPAGAARSGASFSPSRGMMTQSATPSRALSPTSSLSAVTSSPTRLRAELVPPSSAPDAAEATLPPAARFIEALHAVDTAQARAVWQTMTPTQQGCAIGTAAPLLDVVLRRGGAADVAFFAHACAHRGDWDTLASQALAAALRQERPRAARLLQRHLQPACWARAAATAWHLGARDIALLCFTETPRAAQGGFVAIAAEADEAAFVAACLATVPLRARRLLRGRVATGRAEKVMGARASRLPRHHGVMKSCVQ